MEKYKNSRTKTVHLKYQLQQEMKNLNCLIDQIQYQIFKIILSISVLLQFVIKLSHFAIKNLTHFVIILQ